MRSTNHADGSGVVVRSTNHEDGQISIIQVYIHKVWNDNSLYTVKV